MYFFKELHRRNKWLFWFGLFNLLIAVVLIVLMQVENTQILGVNRWLKPYKFYASVGIMSLTMGWLMYYLDNSKAVKSSSIAICISMFFENGLILLQAIRGTTSHFNNSSSYNSTVFSLMGIAIIVFTITCIRICIRFFRQKQFSIPPSYVWGIRLGILFFILFSLEGGIMISMMKHTVGAADGGPGILLFNWSTAHGDLRIAHFLGIHSLQVLSLMGFYVARTKTQAIIFSLVYVALVTVVLIQALSGISLFS